MSKMRRRDAAIRGNRLMKGGMVDAERSWQSGCLGKNSPTGLRGKDAPGASSVFSGDARFLASFSKNRNCLPLPYDFALVACINRRSRRRYLPRSAILSKTGFGDFSSPHTPFSHLYTSTDPQLANFKAGKIAN
jgi:hypothetical protein